MSRAARLTITDKPTWYFLHTRTKPTIKKGALNEPDCGDKLLSIIALYSTVYECELAGVFISKYHYVLVVKFQKYRKLSQKILLDKIKMVYEGKQPTYKNWSKKDWSEFNDRLFNVGEYMRAIQMTFSRWHSKTFKHKGKKLWAERFKSVILTNETVALDAVLYAETGPVREKVSKDLTSYKYSSNYLRNKGAKWLMPISNLIDKAKYQQMLQHRAKLPVKASTVIANEIKNGYRAGCYLKRQRYFLDGLVLGTEKDILAWKNYLRNNGRYLRKPKAHKLEVGSQYSIREQRSHYQEYK